MTHNEIQEQVIRVIAEITETPIEEIQLDTKLDDVYIDSLDLAEIWTELESIMKIKIPDPYREPIIVSDIVWYLDGCINTKD